MSDLTGTPSDNDPTAAPTSRGARRSFGDGNASQFGTEIHSITIHGSQRTFYIDLKESSNGKFFKVSEKSRGGKKSTIMFDSENLEDFIKAFNEMKGKLS